MAEKVVREAIDAVRLLQPGPVALLTSRFRSSDNVMTVAWMAPVSFDPPLVAVAIHPGRLTHEYVSKSEYFALSFPTADLLVAIHRCGMLSGRDGDKLVAAGIPFEDALYPREKHTSKSAASKHFHLRMTEFFDRHLKPGS